jgi:hypothetical protein
MKPHLVICRLPLFMRTLSGEEKFQSIFAVERSHRFRHDDRGGGALVDR